MAFARAVVLGSKAILLDEFTANLDPGNVALLENDVRRYNKETGGTVILATHNLYQAKRISDRTAFLFEGRIVEEGPTNNVFKNPKKPLTKRFLSGELAW
jgi:tungstate transport system ATP-binding protein